MKLRRERGEGGLTHLSTAALACSLSMVASAAVADPSLVLVGGRIWTGDPARPEAAAAAMENGRITAVGDDASVRALAGPATRVIELKGRRVVPGFNDAHVHILWGGGGAAAVQLGDANTPEEMRRRVAAFARTQPKGAWLRYGYWDHHRWTPETLPTHALIDDVTPDNPALLWRLDGHTALANAFAMRLAHVDRSTPDPPGGVIERDARGDPTGIFKDQATDLIANVMPDTTPAEDNAAVTAALAEAARHGVTSLQTLTNGPDDLHDAAALAAVRRAQARGALTARIYVADNLRDWRALAGGWARAGAGDPVVRYGLLKSFADGADGSMTAWMDAPYLGSHGNVGKPSTDLADPAGMFARMQGADRAGLQLATHAIGTRANHEILDLYERVASEDGPRDRRFRIEHAQHLRPEDIARFGRLGVIASMQPYHAIDDGRWVEPLVGPERARSSYAWRSLLDSGAVIAFGSDWPVAPLDPILGIYAAVTRATLDGKHPAGWHPEQKITVAEAVRAYTWGSAYAEFQDGEKGIISPGRLADLVVLSDDIFNMPPAAIAKARVDLTIFNGTVVYERR